MPLLGGCDGSGEEDQGVVNHGFLEVAGAPYDCTPPLGVLSPTLGLESGGPADLGPPLKPALSAYTEKPQNGVGQQRLERSGSRQALLRYSGPAGN